ncbi:MAG: division/cell wall cluster transcriptional repressor MraZ [Phycisphaerales bacterium]
MLFTGSSELNIDAKGRLSIPSRYRSQLKESENLVWISLPWPDGSIRLYTEHTFEELASSWNASLTLTEDQAALRRTIFAASERIEPDSAGRIRVPQRHLELAEIGSEVVLLGAGAMLEIRDRAAWQADELRRFRELPSLVARTTRSSS